VLLRWALFFAVVASTTSTTAWAQRASTQDSLSRVEETLEAREQDGVFAKDEIGPLILVSAQPAFEETRVWFPTAAAATLVRAFGAGAVRICEACMAPRVWVDDGALRQDIGALTLDDIVRLDTQMRGTTAAARTAVWIDENTKGVSVRMIDLASGRVVFAENFDPKLKEVEKWFETSNATRELERRARGEALTHISFDAALYPSQHISMDILEQWGDDNRNLSGLSLSVWDPLLGVGAAYYRVIPEAFNLTLGGQVLVSLPTALGAAITGDVGTEFLDPLLTGAVVARLPIGSSNYGVYAMASTNLRIGIGLSLMNVSLFPVLP
jgi:hypothetical protein